MGVYLPMRYVKTQKNEFENIGVEYYYLFRIYYAQFSRQRSCGANLCITDRSDLTRGLRLSPRHKRNVLIRLSRDPMTTCFGFNCFICIHVRITLRYVSTPRQLQLVRGNVDRGAT